MKVDEVAVVYKEVVVIGDEALTVDAAEIPLLMLSDVVLLEMLGAKLEELEFLIFSSSQLNLGISWASLKPFSLSANCLQFFSVSLFGPVKVRNIKFN